MEIFEDLCHALPFPWGPKLTSILVDDQPPHECWNPSTAASGYGVVYQQDDGCWMKAAKLMPFVGLQETSQWVFHISNHSNVTFPEGTWVGFDGMTVDAIDKALMVIDLSTSESTTCWVISDYIKEFPVSFLHMFSGAFCGWERSMKWLEEEKHITVQQSVSVDCDEEAMKIWQLRTGAHFIVPPIACHEKFFDKVYGILGCVDKDNWNNIIQCHANLIATMSPPCQPWSLGGKQQGFQSQNGLHMAYAIRKIRLFRPICVAFECADRIVQHPHFLILKSAFKYAGYFMTWSKVVPMTDFGMQRTRWLATWLRNDLEAKHLGNLILGTVQKMMWNDPLYRFTIPDQIDHQLKLSRELLNVYGNVLLLPGTLRTRLGSNPTVNEVLRARCLSENDIIPTLVASYSQQHLIDRNHLSNKGIFAFLCEGSNGFMFVDPLRFVALLGAPTNETAPIPSKLDIAFRQLGNAISVPHAMYALVIALSASGFINVVIPQTISDCWEKRILTNNSVVLRFGDFVFVTPWKLLVSTIGKQISSGPSSPSHVVNFFEADCQVPIEISDSSRLVDILRAFGIVAPVPEAFKFFSEKGLLGLNVLVSEITNIVVHGFFHEMLWGKFVILPKEIGHSTCNHDCDEFDHEISKQVESIEKKIAEQGCISPTIPYIVDQGEGNHVGCEVICHENFTESSLTPTGCEDASPFEDKIWVFIHDSQSPVKISWPKGLSNDSANTRIQFLLPPDQVGINFVVECSKHCVPGVDRIFIVVPQKLHQDFAVVLLHTPSTGFVGVRASFREAIPWNVAVQDFPEVVSVKLNGKSINPFVKIILKDGDCIESSEKKPRHNEFSEAESDRADIFHRQGRALAIDECNWFCKCIRLCPDVFAHPAYSPSELIHGISDIVRDHCNMKRHLTCIPILFHEHWAACEIKGTEKIHLSFVNMPHGSKTFLNDIAHRIEIVNLKRTHISKTNIHYSEGFCGWAILFRWWKAIPGLSKQVPAFASLAKSHDDSLWKTLGDQPRDPCNYVVWEFAIFIRERFVKECPKTSLQEPIRTGSGVNETQAPDVSMQQEQQEQSSQQVDPWSLKDPWMSDRKLCKWEDLKLPTDHYFMHKDGTKPPVVQKQQLNHSSKAVAFATKAGVVSTFNAIGSKSVALIIPASDKNRFEHNPDLIITGPFEIIVQDALSSTVYKRQIHLVQLSDEIVFEMPKASYKATAPELKELVLEFDERLINKDFIESLTHKPLETFRRKFADLVPSAASKNINTYSFRVVQVQNPQHRIFQAMCKVPANQRISCLERSGTTEMFIRDFIPRGEEISDITTIPRFWTCDRLSREDALRTAMTITGFTGLVLTRRGIAVRCICGKIAEMRKVLLPNDDRICGLNIAVIPRVVIDSTGWPASISAHEVVKATNHAVSLPPIPTRCFKVMGVTTWSLAFEKQPSTNRFLIDFNGSSFEILLSNPIDKAVESKPTKKGKGFAKGSGKIAKGGKGDFSREISEKDNENSQRITALEAKFTTLEKRQDGLENRINDGFSSVNDQLRQVLNVIAPRGQNDPTGLSPPPKISKTGV